MTLQIYTSFQTNLLQAHQDAARVGFLVNELPYPEGRYNVDFYTLKRLNSMVEMIQKFIPYARPTQTQELEIFRLLGARQVYTYKLLENEKFPSGLIQIMMSYLVNDVEGFEEFEVSFYKDDKKMHENRLKKASENAREGFLKPLSIPDQLKMSMLLVNLEDDKTRKSTCKVEEVPELTPDG